MIDSWTIVERVWTNQCSVLKHVTQTWPVFWPTQFCMEQSLFGDGSLMVRFQKSQAALGRRCAQTSNPEYFHRFQFLGSEVRVTQELFVAARALGSVATSRSGPEIRIIAIEQRGFVLKLKNLNSQERSNFQHVWNFSSGHLIPPAPAAPPSPSLGSFFAIAKKMSFTFSFEM